MSQPTPPITIDFPISNAAAILEFTDGLFPSPTESFFSHDQIHQTLTATFNALTIPELKAGQRILDNYQFRLALQSPSVALLKLDVRSLPTRSLSLISAILAKTIPDVTPSSPTPVLACFCGNGNDTNQSSDSNTADYPDPLNPSPSALAIIITLTTQLLLFLSTHHPNVDLTGTMLQSPHGAYFRAKNNLNDSLELLGTLLLTLPTDESIFIIVDNVGHFAQDSEFDLVLGLVRVIALTQHRVHVKVVVTGTSGGFSDWLDGYFREADMYTSICTAIGHSFKGTLVDLEDAIKEVKRLMEGGEVDTYVSDYYYYLGDVDGGFEQVVVGL